MAEQQSERGRGMPAGETVRVADLVSWQEGSVVSRQIIKQDKGNVTLFAFDQQQGLTEHTSHFDALAHVVEGEAEIRISGKPMRVKAGEMVLMPANQPHALTAVTRFKMLLTMIRA